MDIIRKFFSDLLSIDESRKSCVVLILISMTILGIYKAKLNGDIPENVMTIILTLSALVFGNNAISSVANIIQSSRQNGNNSSYGYSSNYSNYNNSYNNPTSQNTNSNNNPV